MELNCIKRKEKSVMIRSKRTAGIFAFIFALVLSFCSIVPITASNDSLDIPEAAVVVMREQCGQ